MSQARCSDADFISTFERLGPTKMAAQFRLSVRNVMARRKRLEERLGRPIKASAPNSTERCAEYPHRIPIEIRNGVVLVGSDAHYWPGVITTAHRAFVRFAAEMQPKAVIMNGDVMDGATISRHPPIGWEDRPSVADEILSCQERLKEIIRAAPAAQHLWPLGNHDSRLETRLATVAPEFAKVHGIHLKDHFPQWRPCWSIWINDDVVVKHRWKGGVHATHNNAVGSGKTMVTGHLHSLKVTPYADYNGNRFGVDTGTLAEPYGPQFVNYMEDAPANWRSGFAVLTFDKGRLLWPELVHVLGPDEIEFRGKVITV